MRVAALCAASWSTAACSRSEGGEVLALLMMAALARLEYCSRWRREGGCPTRGEGYLDVIPSSRGMQCQLDGEEAGRDRRAW